MKSRTIYLALVFVAVSSIAAAAYANNALITVVAAPTAVLAVLGVLVQAFRDELSHDRSVALQALQQATRSARLRIWRRWRSTNTSLFAKSTLVKRKLHSGTCYTLGQARKL